jgi:hypothetical protein
MATYEINDVSGYKILKNSIDEFIGKITTIPTDLAGILYNIHDFIKKIKSVKKNTSDEIISNDTDTKEITNIHFLTASIYRYLVLKVLENLPKNLPDEPWNALKDVVTNSLKLEAGSPAIPTTFNNFYINPLNPTVANSTINIDQILMYQLLQQLITNNMAPNMDNVLNFLCNVDIGLFKDINNKRVKDVFTQIKDMPTQDSDLTTYDNSFQLLQHSLEWYPLTNPGDDTASKIIQRGKFVQFANLLKKEMAAWVTYTTDFKKGLTDFLTQFNDLKSVTSNNGDGTNVDFDTLSPQEKTAFLKKSSLDQLMKKIKQITDLSTTLADLEKEIKTIGNTPTYLTDLYNEEKTKFNIFMNELEGKTPNDLLTKLETKTGTLGSPFFSGPVSILVGKFKDIKTNKYD